MTRDGRGARRYLALVLVTVGHALVVAFLMRQDEAMVAISGKDSRPLLWLELNPPDKAPATVRLDAAQPPQPGGRRSRRANPQAGVSPASPASAAAGNASTAVAPTDWYGLAEQVSKSQSGSILEQLRHLCAEAARRGAQPAECRRYKKPDAWVPEPRKFGIAGGLPYVRLGKRCVVGLGFFGCAIGKLPEADGHVLDDMREPDKPWSSTPDLTP